MNSAVDAVDLEDGELPSSDEDKQADENTEHFLGCEDYVVPERPMSLTKALLKQSTIGLTNSKSPPSEDESDANCTSSNISSDSEDDINSKKRRMTDKNSITFNTSSSHEPGTSASTNSSAFQEAAQKFQNSLPKKVNNIWADVIHDEQAAQMINQLGMKQQFTVERGSESYMLDIRKRKRTRADSESSEISSGGLSENAKEYLRSYEDVDSSKLVQDTSGLGAEMHSDENVTLSENGGKHRSRSKKRKRRRERQSHKQRMVKKLSKMDDKEFANFLIYSLGEPKQALMFRVVSVLGRQTAERLFLKTLKIQRRGGLYIRNQQRLRTPGGVLLYLIRGDDKISEGTVDELFKLEKQQFNKMKKKELDKKRRRLRFELRKQQLKYQNIAGGDGMLPLSGAVDDNDGYINSSDEAKINIDEEDEDEDSPDEDCIDLHCDPSDLIT